MKELAKAFLAGPANRSRRARGGSTIALRWAAVAGYLVLALGIPLPAGTHIDVSQPFPCMHHRCGCYSAEQCWRDCCCMSFDQKLAWARDNEVTPPDYVLAEAQARGIPGGDPQTTEQQVAHEGASPKQCSCCCKSTCCPTVPQEADCCQAESTKPAARQKASRHPQGVVLIEALACRGADSNWAGVSVSLPPPAEVTWTFAAGEIERIELFSERYCGISIPPSTPPPRLPVA